MRFERYAGEDRAIVSGWIDRVVSPPSERRTCSAPSALLVASGMVDSDQEGIRQTLQVLGLFGVAVTSVMQMRVVAQLLRSEEGGTRTERV